MILFKNGKIFDGQAFHEGLQDVLVTEGRVDRIGPGIEADGAKRIDIGGKTVSPGVIDLHCYMRDTGCEWREDIQLAEYAVV